MNKHIEIKIIGLYTILLTVVIVSLRFLFFEELFHSGNFLNWDAEHYNWIRENGYEGFRVAFFPLFPLVWRILHVGIYGIVILNGIIFLVSFYVLAKDLKLSITEMLICLSIPSFIFFYLPYTESIFFLSSTILLLGLKHDRVPLVCIGLLLATLSRPAFTIFIPALVIVELFSEKRKNLMGRLGLYFSVIAVGMLLVGIIQYVDTGEWFKFFSIQKNWGNELQIPALPLTTWAGDFMVRLDSAAFLVGTIAGGFLTAFILKIKPINKLSIPKEVLFSLAYLGGISLSVLIFRGGSLYSLNRFVFATPFIIVAFHFWLKQGYSFNTRQLLIIFGLIFAFWFLFGSYVHIQNLLKFLFLTVYMFLIFVMRSDNDLLRKMGAILFISLNIIFQVVLYVRFLSGDWVG
jgi:hypothetical protein